MDDLTKLNRRIALHWLGRLDANQEAYVTYASVCIGRLLPDAFERAQALSNSTRKHYNCLSVAKLNRQYLRYARLASKDVAAGRFEMLVRLGLTLDQAVALANLNNDDISRLAFEWQGGRIISFARDVFLSGARLHSAAARHHAAAFVAAGTDLTHAAHPS